MSHTLSSLSTNSFCERSADPSRSTALASLRSCCTSMCHCSKHDYGNLSLVTLYNNRAYFVELNETNDLYCSIVKSRVSLAKYTLTWSLSYVDLCNWKVAYVKIRSARLWNLSMQCCFIRKAYILYTVTTMCPIKRWHFVFICPIAIAYSMGQIIKSVCVCQSACVCVCLSVRVSSLSRSHFFVDFHQIWHRGVNPQK